MLALHEAGCRDFFVSTWAEAEELGACPTARACRCCTASARRMSRRRGKLGARPVLNSVEQVERWKAIAPGPAVRRDGRHRHEPARAAAGGDRLPRRAAIDTLMSHLACADEDHPLNAAARALPRGRAAVPARRYSLANSAGICLGATMLRSRPARASRSTAAFRGARPKGTSARSRASKRRSSSAARSARARAAAMARPSSRARTPRPRSSTSAMPTAICAASPRAGAPLPASSRCRCSAACRWT
jgi:hypothetical protein